MTYDPIVRANAIGASDIPAIIGVSPFASSSPWALALRKRFPHSVASAPDTSMQKLGHALEAELVAMVKGSRRNTAPVFKEWEFGVYATPDGFDANDCPIEAKVVGINMTRHWDLSARDASGVPDYVRVQAAWQMFVTDKPTCTVVAYVMGTVCKYEVKRNEALERELVFAAGAFWARISDGVPTLDIDGTKECRELLRLTRPPAKKDAPVESVAEVTKAYQAYYVALETSKTWTRKKEEALSLLATCTNVGGRYDLGDGRVLAMHATGPAVSKLSRKEAIDVEKDLNNMLNCVTFDL